MNIAYAYYNNFISCKAMFKWGFDRRLNSLDDSILHINVCHERLVIVDNLGSFHEKTIALEDRNSVQCHPQTFTSNQCLISNVSLVSKLVCSLWRNMDRWQQDMMSHWPRAGRVTTRNRLFLNGQRRSD